MYIYNIKLHKNKNTLIIPNYKTLLTNLQILRKAIILVINKNMYVIVIDFLNYLKQLMHRKRIIVVKCQILKLKSSILQCLSERKRDNSKHLLYMD